MQLIVASRHILLLQQHHFLELAAWFLWMPSLLLPVLHFMQCSTPQDLTLGHHSLCSLPPPQPFHALHMWSSQSQPLLIAPLALSPLAYMRISLQTGGLQKQVGQIKYAAGMAIPDSSLNGWKIGAVLIPYICNYRVWHSFWALNSYRLTINLLVYVCAALHPVLSTPLCNCYYALWWGWKVLSCGFDVPFHTAAVEFLQG